MHENRIVAEIEGIGRQNRVLIVAGGDDLLGEPRQPVEDRGREMLRQHDLQQGEAIVERTHRHRSLATRPPVALDQSLSGQCRGDLSHHRAGATGRLVLRDLESGGVVETQRLGIHPPLSHGQAYDHALSDDLAHVRGRDVSAPEGILHSRVVGLQETGIREDELEAALCHAPGGGILGDHRPMNRLPMMRMLAHIVIEHAHPVGEKAR